MIEDVSFGKLVFRGKVYRSDCIIHGDSINSRWWRKEGDKILYEDLEDLVKLKPDTIVIGKGFMNYINIPKDTIEKLSNMNIEVIVRQTDKAVEVYNVLIERKDKNIVGLFHLV